MTEPGRELLVVRHGKSSWDAPTRSDAERPLTPRGRRDCRRLAAWCAEHALLPDLVYASPAERAADTALRIALGVGLGDDEIVTDPRLYLASLPTLLDVLAEVPEGLPQIVLVGHNPGLDHLVLYLAREEPPRTRSGKLMTTAAAARFRMPVSWARLERGCAELVELVRPKHLRDP